MLTAVNGIELYWEEHGDGEPLLWLHGTTGRGADWRYIFNDPPAGCRLIAPDLRGHGTSTNPERIFTFRQMALDVVALMQQLRIGRVKAIGLSGGGITLLHMAVMAPELIESMVLVSAPPRFPDQARAIQRAMSPELVGEAEMQRLRLVHAHGEAQIGRLFAMVRSFADSGDDVNFTRETLGAIEAESLIVFGDRDFLYPVSLAFELHDALKKSYLWVVPNGGHGPVFGEAAGPFATTALAFLRGDWNRKPSANQ